MALQQIFDLSDDSVLSGVGVYYNEENLLIELYKGGQRFVPERNYYTTSAKVGSLSAFNVCEGTTLVRFEGIPVFPFAKRKLTENAIACISQLGALTILSVDAEDETEAGANDGVITIEARAIDRDGLQGGITYSLNGSTPQTSNSFTGITPGGYVVTVNGGGYTRQVPVTIAAYPYYNKRYVFEYTDIEGQESEIIIYKKFYTGTAKLLKAVGPQPIAISTGSAGQERHKCIRGGEAQLEKIAFDHFEFLELYSNDEREYLVEFKKFGSVAWKGYVLPDIYNEPYADVPYYVGFSATDGLGTLKDIPYTTLAGNKIRGIKSQLQVIIDCLKHLKLHLPIYTAIHTYETTMFDGEDDDPLVQAEVDTEAYEDMNCYEVIEHILTPYGGRIWQEDGAWMIVITEIVGKRQTAWRPKLNDAYCEQSGDGSRMKAWRARVSDAFCEQN